jgi:hypothetical protein
MEAWQIHRFDMPRLVPVAAQLDDDGHTVVLKSAVNEYQISSREIDGQTLLDSLRSMADPNAQIWADVRLARALPWQTSLVKQLDELSLVQGKPADQHLFNVYEASCEKLVRDAEKTLIRMASDQPDSFRNAISTFLHILDLKLPEIDSFSVDTTPKISDRNDFAAQTFFLQRIYVDENLPVVASLWRQVLIHTGLQLGMTFVAESNIPKPPANSIGFYCSTHIEAYLLCLIDLLRLATTKDCVRRINADARCDRIDTGINFMRNAEEFARASLTCLGESRYLAAVNDSAAKFGPLVQGLFIEQYHVTQRFVEIIAPLMTKRTRTPIKQRIYRYFQEELGHETFERATCLALGVTSKELDTALPLPLFQAYVDAFTVLGRYDAIGYMSSIMVTEGMLGVDNPIHDRLETLASSQIDYQRVAKRHDDLNIELNHASLSRLFFEEVQAISPEAQQRALANLSFLIELNFRAMDQAVDFYGSQRELNMCSLAAYEATFK